MSAPCIRPPEGVTSGLAQMPDKKMVGVDYKTLDWWHIVEFSGRGMVIVARASGGGDEPWEEDFTEEFV